ncbi:response regulator [Brevundimonas sp. NPDC092305]|uniref:response regulator n=1 Tax=Brevundimonas sp. NPDC092305 TaxID=3363957 RepID=UPI0038075DEC
MAQSSDILGGRRRGFRLSVARRLALWTGGLNAVAGVAALALFAALRPEVLGALTLLVVSIVWLGVSCVAGGIAAWRLSALFARPGDTLLALKRIEGDTAPVDRNALEGAYRGLDDLLVRAAHERQGRINELVRAREAARAESEAKAGFLAGMSHELRTPLNAIIGYAMLLSEDAADQGSPASIRDLARILQSSRHLLRLINDILDMSRLDAGEVAFERAVVDVQSVVEAVASTVEAGEAGGLIVSVAPNARVMLGDAMRLRQCLIGLAGHVVEASRDKTPALSVVLADGDEGRIQFRLYDPEGRLLAAALSVQDGEGGASRGALNAGALAVTVTRRLAGLMGGSLIQEPHGDGCVFVLTLPMNSVAGHDVAPAAVVDAPVAPASNASFARTVLVVDDDDATRDLLKRWLGAQGYRVLTASNGPQGLALARSQRPNFMVLDIFMPGQSGYEVLAEMKSDPDLSGIPVIVASSDDNRRLGLAAGAAEVLVKPLSRDRLRDTLDILGRQVPGDILVVDDDEDVREIVQRYAGQAGLTVRLAANGEEGLAMARQHTPGAIVLDLCMPEVDGFAMMESLSRDPSLKTVPVMVLSQLDLSVQEHARIREAGHVFHPKWKASPLQIVENIKTMVRQ